MTKPKTIAADPWAKHVAPTQPAPQPKPAKPRAKATKPAGRKKAVARKRKPLSEQDSVADILRTAKVQLSLRFNPILLDRARNACHALNISLQGMIDQSLDRELARLEKENGGKFPPRPGRLKTGPRPQLT